MPYFLSPFGNQQAFDANGNPLVGGSWRTFRAGTSTAETTYTSQAGTTQQGVIMTLDALGLPVNGPVWMLNGIALKFRLFNAAGVVLDEWDNITGIGDVNVAPDEWVLFNATPTYVSPTVFTVAGDQTNVFQVKRRLKSTNTGGTVYSTIVSAVFAASATTVTVTNTSGALDAGLSAVNYGLLSVTNPSVPETYAKSGTNNDITALNALSISGPGLIPVGTIYMYAAPSTPAGSLLCPTAATNISRTTYANLFGAIGTTWGVGDGSTTFGLPWFPVGYAPIQASGNEGTSTTGTVIGHIHGIGIASIGGAGINNVQGAGNARDPTLQTDSTGGAANFAAGVRVRMCVKY